MQNSLNESSPKKNYAFIDHIRCLAMMSIVAEHTLGSYHFPEGSARYWIYILIVQFAKFGTVIFFLLAGFLISEKFTDYTPGEYLKRRFASTFGPWLFWSVIFIVCYIVNLHVKERMYHDGRFNLANILKEAKETYLYTNYWFIINFMVSISLLLIFKKYLYSYKFGAVLLLFTLIYCVNIHFEWFDPSHTTAILGFVFFLWLGAQLRKHWLIVEYRVKLLPFPLLILLVVITFALSVMETRQLFNTHSVDPYNTLRFTNVLYSLSGFTLLLRVKEFAWLNKLRPRDTTYGIYLIHYILVIYLLPEIYHGVKVDPADQSTAVFYLIKLLSFVIVYALSWWITILLTKSKAHKLVGN
ncbi:acyltransferase [Mucilaginibacter sp. RS28]|uniref:Acyltransferase n=1 Tax=Mucilaginibacter straminoryzae TaxID=2932774 RepID=A0A9X2BA49_9SPHI|nr:acyltransferase [Mucilaginibacter straminoryzae]MCJ8208427.1 acyltransferase [Mucilaginibacter straminoryzae]